MSVTTYHLETPQIHQCGAQTPLFLVQTHMSEYQLEDQLDISILISQNTWNSTFVMLKLSYIRPLLSWCSGAGELQLPKPTTTMEAHHDYGSPPQLPKPTAKLPKPARLEPLALQQRSHHNEKPWVLQGRVSTPWQQTEKNLCTATQTQHSQK